MCVINKSVPEPVLLVRDDVTQRLLSLLWTPRLHNLSLNGIINYWGSFPLFDGPISP